MKFRIIPPTIQNQVVKKRVCAYVRVSTNHTEQEESLENQVAHYTQLIECHPEYEYVGIFIDQGITGTKENRPQFQEMLSQCRQNKIDMILTKSISRFARNTTIILEYIRELKGLGVEVQFENENIRTLDGDGELMLAVFSAFAQEESRSMSENRKWALEKRFEQGKLLINTNRFLGYDKDEYGDLTINRAEAQIVESIFAAYLNGKGCYTIAKELNQKGLVTVTGRRWSERTILEIIKNEKYKGEAILQKFYVKDPISKKKVRNTGERPIFYIQENHSPIISIEDWDKAQELMRERARAKSNKGGKSCTKRYPLSGMLYCSKCGGVLKRRVWNSQRTCRKIVWQCSNYIKEGKQFCLGTTLPDELASTLNIKEPAIIKEEVENGEKYYTHTPKAR